MMVHVRARGYVDREAFIESFVAGRRVLHCGAVGATCMDTDMRLDYLPRSLHWRIERSASETVGIDTAEDVITEASTMFPSMDLRAVSLEDAPAVLSGEPRSRLLCSETSSSTLTTPA